MASFLNSSYACGGRGQFPIGIGNNDYDPASRTSIVLPQSNGTIHNGYALMTSSTAAPGLAYSYIGANGRTISSYQFPTNCPSPLPSPEEIESDLVLITREDPVTRESGLIDLNMPSIGTQGLAIQHGLPSLCDPVLQLVFFFDNANAAINVYNIRTNSWRMGWLRAAPSYDFKWAAADLLTSNKIKSVAPTYPAPYNVPGIFFSAASNIFFNSNEASFPPANQPGLYFINYTADANGNINVWNPANDFFVPTLAAYGSSLNVTAILVLDQKVSTFNSNNTVGGSTTSQYVIAVGVGGGSSIATLSGSAWWGFLAYSGGLLQFVNPNCVTIAATAALNFRILSGYVQTISIDPETLRFFLGGNYSSIHFKNVLVNRTINGFSQTSGVAMQYVFNRTTDTITNYEFVGSNATIVAKCRNWSGRITQSSWADGCFAYGGNFKTPPSERIEPITVTSAPTVGAVYTYVAPTLQTTAQNTIITPYAELNLTTFQKPVGEYLDSLKISFADLGVFDNTGNVLTQNNFCVAFSPADGDVRQSSFPPVPITGYFYSPTSYVDDSFYLFQSQTTVIGTEWWYSYISFYVESDYGPTRYRAYMFFDNTNISVYFNAPFQWTDTVSLKKGKNYLPILGGGTQLANNAGGGTLFNSNNIVTGAGAIALDGLPRLVYVRIQFLNPDGISSKNIRIGTNHSSRLENIGCWTLEGYPCNGITATNNPGLFSSTALQAGTASQAVSGTDRDVTFTNVNASIPTSFNKYNVIVIPINYLKTRAGFTQYTGTTITKVEAIFVSDRQGDFDSSVMNFSTAPSVLYNVPNMNNSESVSPAISLFMTDRLSVYKNASAQGDTFALGAYTNFPQNPQPRKLWRYGETYTGTNNKYNVGFVNNTKTSFTINTLNDDDENIDYTKIINNGDLIEIRLSSDPTKFDMLQINSFTQNFNPSNYTATFATTLLYQTLPDIVPPASFVIITLTFIVKGTPQTPFVLKDNFGSYLIGNGSQPNSVKDVYLSPAYGTYGKAYRYIPNYETSFLTTKSNVKLTLGASTSDDTIIADTITFNSNGSSVLLSKGSTVTNTLGSYWTVVSTNGNVGFNTQNI